MTHYLMKYKTVLIVGLLLFVSCSHNAETEKNNYYFVDHYIHEDCDIYGMIFSDGQYAFRIALAGQCNSLSKDAYINEYKKILTEYLLKNTFETRSNIRLEYYDALKIDDKAIEQIIKITESKTGKRVLVREVWDQGMRLELIKK